MNAEEILKLLERPEWVSRAACRGTDPNNFYAQGKGRPTMDSVIAAKRVCRSCPVKEQCYDHGQECNEDGIWGGNTEDERQRFRRGFEHYRCALCNTRFKPRDESSELCSVCYSDLNPKAKPPTTTRRERKKVAKAIDKNELRKLGLSITNN